MLNMKTLNSQIFNVRQLRILLKYAFLCIDFNTKDLTRDINSTIGTVTEEKISDFFCDVCDITHDICIQKNLKLNVNILKKRLPYNSDDLVKLVKYCFQHTAIINHADAATQKNHNYFLTNIFDMLKKVHSNSFTFTKISDEFKIFIGQLIRDGQTESAEVIHLMIQLGHKIIVNEQNEASASFVGAMLSMPFYQGLQFNAFGKDDDLLLTNTNKFYVDLNAFKQGSQLVLIDPFFNDDFSIDLYALYSQDYQDHVSHHTEDTFNKPPANLLYTFGAKAVNSFLGVRSHISERAFVVYDYCAHGGNNSEYKKTPPPRENPIITTAGKCEIYDYCQYGSPKSPSTSKIEYHTPPPTYPVIKRSASVVKYKL